MQVLKKSCDLSCLTMGQRMKGCFFAEPHQKIRARITTIVEDWGIHKYDPIIKELITNAVLVLP